MMAYDQPSPTDMFGAQQAVAPPALGTTQYWSKFTPSIAVGSTPVLLNRKGNLIRNLFLTFRNAAGHRDEACVPEAITFKWDNRTEIELDVDAIRELMWERTGVLHPAGTVILDDCHEFSGKIGDELRDGYLRTLQASNLNLTLNGVGTAGTCEVLTNDVVVPDGADIYQS